MSSQALLSRSNLSWNELYHCTQTAMAQRNPISPPMLYCDDAHHACLVDCCNLHILYQVVYISGPDGHDSLY